MDSLSKVLKQVSRLCRHYPGTLTPAEVVGRAYLLLGDTPGTTKKVRALVEGLHKTELLKMVQAATEVELASAGADGFTLGMVYRPEEGACGIDAGDQAIPMDFVHELKRTLEIPKSGTSAVS